MKKIVFALSALMLSMSMLIGCSKSGAQGELDLGEPIGIWEENVLGLWQRYAFTAAGQSDYYIDMYRQYLDFKEDSRILKYDYDGEYRGYNNWSMSEGIITIMLDENQMDKSQLEVPNEWQILHLSEKYMQVKYTLENRGEIKETFMRPASHPTFIGGPEE